jgi:hypothetical protein
MIGRVTDHAVLRYLAVRRMHKGSVTYVFGEDGVVVTVYLNGRH